MVEVVPVMNVMVVMEVVWMSIPIDHNTLLWKVGLIGRDRARRLGFLEVIQSLLRGAALRLPQVSSPGK